MATSREDRRGIGGPAGEVGAGGGGSNDTTSGSGAGGGTPDADTAMRAGKTVTGGDVDEDRQKLFPESSKGDQPGAESGHQPHAIPPPKGG